MFFRMLKGALFRQRTRQIMIILTVALGASVATSMLSVLFDVGDKMNQELKAYGSNIVVRPKGAAVVQDLYNFENAPEQTEYLSQEELPRIKTIFWTYNILDFAPLLNTTVAFDDGATAPMVGSWFSEHLDLPTGETLDAGLKNMRGWWKIEGDWPDDADTNTALLGEKVAVSRGLSVGDSFSVDEGGQRHDFTVSGIFTSGTDEDSRIFTSLLAVQRIIDKPGAVGQVEVSALTTPDNDLARKAAKNPASLSITDKEKWYCTAYVSSIAYQIEEVITDSVARPVRQVSESEGQILEKTQLLMVLITVLSLAGSALAIANLVTANVIDRSPEIGLLKAVGARDRDVVLLLLAEVALIGAIGCVLGYGVGLLLAQVIGQIVFSSSISLTPAVAAIVAALVTVFVLIGSIPAVRYLLHLRPAEVLHGR